MAVKDSEMIRQRVEVGKTVKAGIDTYQGEIAEAHDAYLASDLLEGETLPATGTYLRILSRKVDGAVDTIEQLNTGVVDKARDTGTHGFQIDEVTDLVTAQLRGTRHTCRGLFGLDFLKRVGFKGDIPGASLSLYRFGRMIQTGLRDPDLAFTPVLPAAEAQASEDDQDDDALTPPMLADRMNPGLNRLGGLVDDRFTDRREADDVQSRRREAIKKFDHDMVTIVQAVRAIFRAAGREDLAARFRATYKRIVRNSSESSGSEDPAPVSDTPAPVSDTPAPVSETQHR